VQEEIKNLKQEISAIKERNSRVEAEKAWEVSATRTFSIALITYAVAAAALFIIGAQNFLAGALIPALGYWLSTWSLPIIKKLWLKKFLPKNQGLFRCGECALSYRDKEIADRCEAWCRAHHTCNLEIIKHAVSREE
jgi:hypothetical protein